MKDIKLASDILAMVREKKTHDYLQVYLMDYIRAANFNSTTSPSLKKQIAAIRRFLKKNQKDKPDRRIFHKVLAIEGRACALQSPHLVLATESDLDVLDALDFETEVAVARYDAWQGKFLLEDALKVSNLFFNYFYSGYDNTEDVWTIKADDVKRFKAIHPAPKGRNKPPYISTLKNREGKFIGVNIALLDTVFHITQTDTITIRSAGELGKKPVAFHGGAWRGILALAYLCRAEEMEKRREEYEELLLVSDTDQNAEPLF